MPNEKPFKMDQVSIRMVKEPPLYSKEPLTTPEAEIKVLRDIFKDYDREVVCLVNLKNNMQPVNLNIVSIGVIDQAIIHPRELLKSSILSNASSVLIMHNHPSGNLEPSALDISMTDRLQQIFTLMGIDLVDHIIIGNCDNSIKNIFQISFRTVGHPLDNACYSTITKDNNTANKSIILNKWMEDKIMTKNIIIKSLMNGIIGWILAALIFSLMKPDLTFVQGLTTMYPIYLGIAGFAGSLLGFSRKEMMK